MRVQTFLIGLIFTKSQYIGEERDGKLIANKIVQYREKKAIETAEELSTIINKAKKNYNNYKKNESLCDKQIFGPYLHWEHTHIFTSDKKNTIIEDVVNYKLLFGNIIHKLFVKKDLKNIFEYRYKKIEELFKRQYTQLKGAL